MTRLMIPGPTEVSSEVIERMAQPVKPHYGPEWTELYWGVIDKLKQVYQTENDLFVLTATCSSAMEMAVSHAAEPGEEILDCNNGLFADRFREMADCHGIKSVPCRTEWGLPITGDQVREALDSHPKVKALWIVHNESATGVESALTGITAAARERGVLTIVDTVSSMGAVDIPTDRLGIDFCISGSQKCFGAAAGLGFISVSPKAWDAIAARKESVRAWYLSLEILRKYQQNKNRKMHPQGQNTAAVSLYMALNQALDEILEEGLPARFERHVRVSKAFRAAMRAMGLKLYAPDEFASKTVTVIILPEGISSAELRKNVLEKHDILLAGMPAGLFGDTADRMLRVGHMSRTASPEYLLPTIEALEEEFVALGADIKTGAACEVFRRECAE